MASTDLMQSANAIYNALKPLTKDQREAVQAAVDSLLELEPETDSARCSAPPPAPLPPVAMARPGFRASQARSPKASTPTASVYRPKSMDAIAGQIVQLLRVKTPKGLTTTEMTDLLSLGNVAWKIYPIVHHLTDERKIRVSNPGSKPHLYMLCEDPK